MISALYVKRERPLINSEYYITRTGCAAGNPFPRVNYDDGIPPFEGDFSSAQVYLTGPLTYLSSSLPPSRARFN